MKEITLENILNVLLQFKEETNHRFNKIDEHLVNVDKRLDFFDSRFEQIDQRFVSIDGRFEQIDQRFVSFDERFEQIDQHFNISDNRLTSLENIVTRIEYEHGKKLDLLLDYAKGNIEKHEKYDTDITQIDSKLFNHDIRIEVLEEKLPKAL